jgi:hypothetical protein
VATALVLTASPARAEGQESRFSVHPSVRVVGVADDNVFLNDRAKSDLGGWITPRIEATYRTRIFEVGADVGVEVRRYVEHSALADELLRLRGYAEIGLWSGLTMRVSDAYVPQPIQLGLPEDDGSNLAQTNRLDARLRYERELPGGREFELGLRGTRFLSESFAADVPSSGRHDAVLDHFHPDFWEAATYLEFRSPFGRRSSTYARAQFRQRFFDESPRSDHWDLTALIGLRSRWLRNVEIQIAGGWGLISFDSRGDVHRFLGEASLRHRLPSGWSWNLSAAHKFTADLSGNDFVETTGELGVEKRFGERMSASAKAFLSRFDDAAWDRGGNLFGGVEVAIHRQLSRRAQVKLTYRHWRNGGDYDFDDFRQNRLALEFSYRR